VPLVSVVVTHHNLAAYLPEALASVAAQTYSPLDVIVIDDGSTDPRARQVWHEQQHLHRDYRFISQENQGSGAARNRGLAEARGEFVVFLDADNVAVPELVATLVRGLRRNPEVAALTCHILGFRAKRGGSEKEVVFRNAFAGGPHVLACVENVYGDTTALFRTADLRAAGGYETDRTTPWEDWLTYVKLVHAGYRVEVVPASLLLYRVREDGRTARLNRGRADEDRHTQHLLRKYFSGALLPPGMDAASLWPVLVGFARLGEQHDTLRHRLVERLNQRLRSLPWLHRGLKTLAQTVGWLGRWLR
jgi:glycosyltransferase involved in cell wall biosynthesis